MLFVNTYLTMTCLAGYNETNVNRLLVNYKPSDEEVGCRLFDSVLQFENLFWAKSQLFGWNSYRPFLHVYHNITKLKCVSMADVVAVITYCICSGAVEINPLLICQTTRGNPFFIRELIHRHWFLLGIKYRNPFDVKFLNLNPMEERRQQYLKISSKAAKDVLPKHDRSLRLAVHDIKERSIQERGREISFVLDDKGTCRETNADADRHVCFVFPIWKQV